MTPVVAVVPFGAFADDRERAGAWARQIARRVVDRFSGADDIEVRPVFLVSMPQGATEPSYLVFGSTPDEAQAAEYGRSLGATHVLTGTYTERPGERILAVRLVDVASGRAIGTYERFLPTGELPRGESSVAAWLANTVGVGAPTDVELPENEEAYGALLIGMDAEIDATVLQEGDAQTSWSALIRAVNAYGVAARADASSVMVEERILVLAASMIERELQRLVEPALEALIETRPRSWRAHYMLGEVRRASGDVNGAIVALEHADSLRALRPRDSLTLAQLHISAGAMSVAASRLRRLVRSAADPGVTATARRLLLRIKHPDLERDLEEAGRIAVEGDAARADEAAEKFARVIAADPDIWEAHFGVGLLAAERDDQEAARTSFDRAVALNPDAAELVREVVGPRA